MAIPHTPGSFVLSLLSIRTYPSSPQLGPQLFLTIQYGGSLCVVPPVPYPTIRTPWSKFVPQALPVITPSVYSWKSRVSASIATETNTFSLLKTDLKNFKETFYAKPNQHPKTPTLCSALFPLLRKEKSKGRIKSSLV